MNDDELSKAVTEHEGWHDRCFAATRNSHGKELWTDGKGNWLEALPEYATSWEWTGPLVEKYKIRLALPGGSNGNWFAKTAPDSLAPSKRWSQDGNVLRAICLAVLEIEK